MAVAETIHLKKNFGGVLAVNDVSVSFEDGRLYGLVGPNGAGKSTLVNLISGEFPTGSGKIMLNGSDITAEPAHVRAHLGIGRTFQLTHLPGSLTVMETVLSGALISLRTSVPGYLIQTPKTRSQYRQAREQAFRILELVDLHQRAGDLVRELAWADQRRLEVGRALALHPKILLLDEPTAGMHVESLPMVTRMLRRLVEEGLAVAVIEHNVPFIRNTVDWLYAMDAGAIVAYGKPDDVLSADAVKRSYLGEAHD